MSDDVRRDWWGQPIGEDGIPLWVRELQASFDRLSAELVSTRDALKATAHPAVMLQHAQCPRFTAHEAHRWRWSSGAPLPDAPWQWCQGV